MDSCLPVQTFMPNAQPLAIWAKGSVHCLMPLIICIPFQGGSSLNVSKHNSDSPLGQGAWDVTAVEVFPSHTITLLPLLMPWLLCSCLLSVCHWRQIF